MKTTRTSLLHRVRDPHDTDAWAEFYDLYAPLLYRFARSRGLAACDAEEIRDQCLEILTRRMTTFHYERGRGRFKSWLFTIAHGRVVDLQRLRRPVRLTTDEFKQVPDAVPAPEDRWDAHWKAEHFRYAMERARACVSGRTWAVFEHLLEERPVPDICAELGVNRNQVYKARGRVLQAVRDVLTQIGEVDLDE